MKTRSCAATRAFPRLQAGAGALGAIAEARSADAAALSGMMRCAQADIVVGKKELHEKILIGK